METSVRTVDEIWDMRNVKTARNSLLVEFEISVLEMNVKWRKEFLLIRQLLIVQIF